MLVPKWLIGVLLAAGAVCFGWIAKDALGGIASSSAEPPDPDPATEDSTDELVEALAALSSTTQDGLSPPTPVQLTVILTDGRGQPVVAAGVTGPGRSPVQGTPSLGTADAPGGGPEAHPPVAARGHAVRQWNGAPDLTLASGYTGPPLRSVSAAPGLAAPRSMGGMATGGFSLSLSPETAATAIGDHIVIAYDDSIVLVGDYGRLTGNTGDAGQGGVVALDAQGWAFTTRSDATGGSYAAQGNAATLTTGGPGSGAQAGAATVAGNGTMTALVGGSGGYIPNAPPGVVSPLISPIVSFSTGRAVDIAGYEDHSLAVRGQRNVVTYDDSNVFIDRFGQINANTGDTDSAGLNAVDTVRSNVSAGPHCDDGCDDESIIQARAGVFDEGDVAIDGRGNVVWAPDRGDGDNAADEGRRQPARRHR